MCVWKKNVTDSWIYLQWQGIWTFMKLELFDVIITHKSYHDYRFTNKHRQIKQYAKITIARIKGYKQNWRDGAF